MKTYQQWEDSENDQNLDDFLNYEPCEIDEEMYLHIVEADCPSYDNSNVSQSGEASDQLEDGVLTFTTVSRVNGKYFYLGVLPAFEGNMQNLDCPDCASRGRLLIHQLRSGNANRQQ